MHATQYRAGKEVQWHEDELMDFLKTIIPAARLIQIYVGALDKVGETNASRLLNLEVGVMGPEVLTICVENENNEDLETYVQKELKNGIIVGKARGIFLWITLIVPKISIAHAKGNSSKYLKQMVQELLKGLNEFYKDMVKPLSLADLHDFMAVDPDSSYTLFKQCQDSPHYLETDDQMRKKVKNLSEGLAEVKEQNKQLVVQFIHQSVQDYLVKSNRFQILKNPNTISNTTGETSDNMTSHAHLELAKTCLKYLSMEDVVKRG
ncbi:hypothetical protein BU17DRAFT_69499 [Hysterangium stoloniferum]|nr:hypothetical protein BU17DRAFT_69499 [Hysterangium stoloniferum]